MSVTVSRIISDGKVPTADIFDLQDSWPSPFLNIENRIASTSQKIGHLHQLVGISREEQSSFLQGHYRGVRQMIEGVKWYVHRLALLQQPGFEKRRSFPNSRGDLNI